MSVRDLIMSAAGVSSYTGFDIRKAAYNSVLNLAATGCSETWPRGVQFNPAGSTIYLSGYNKHPIWSASVSTPFDLPLSSEWSYSDNLSSVSPAEFSSDFSTVISVGTNGTRINYGVLSTPGLLSSLTYNASNYIDIGYFTQVEGFRFSATGNKLFIAGIASGVAKILEFPLSTAFAVTTIGALAGSIAVPEVQVSTSGDFCFSSDGKCLLVLGSNRVITQYNLSTPWLIISATLAWTFSVAGFGLGYITGLSLENSDTALYITGINSGSYYAIAKYTIG